MKRLAIVAVGVALVVAMASACGGEDEVATKEPATPVPEPTIPLHFTTYTDEEQLFSVSYPSSWESFLSEIPRLRELLKRLLEGSEADIPWEEASVVFAAGVPADEGGDVNVNIVVEPIDASTLEEAAEMSVRGLEVVASEYRQLSRVRTVVGGRNAELFENEMTLAGLPKQRSLQLLVLEGKVLWTVTCGTGPEKFPSVEETCNQVVRSFRILR